MQPGSACVKRLPGACTRAAPLASVGPDTGGAGSSAPVEDGPARPRTIRPAPVSNVPRLVEDGQPGLSNMGSPGPARPPGWPAHRRPVSAAPAPGMASSARPTRRAGLASVGPFPGRSPVSKTAPAPARPLGNGPPGWLPGPGPAPTPRGQVRPPRETGQ